MNVDAGVILTVILACVAGIVWLVRQEGRLKALERIVDSHDNKINEIDSKVVRDLADLKIAVAKIESYLQASRDAKGVSHG